MKKIDHELYAQLLTLPPLPFLRMVRQDRRALRLARQAFFADGTVPTFAYPLALRFDAHGYLAALTEVEKNIAATRAPAALLTLYAKKSAELRLRASCIVAVQQGDDTAVTALANEMFGTPIFSLSELRAELNERLARQGHGHVHTPRIDAELFCRMMRRVLDHYGLTDWRIKIVPRERMQIGHGKRERTPMVRVPKKLLISKRRAMRLLTHEIEVHALRTANGTESPLHLLSRGCAGYILTDEGLAMYYQDFVLFPSTDLTDTERAAPGFWEAYTATLSQHYTFAETFAELASVTTKDAAWRLCVRAYRGITHPTTAGLGFLRDHLYRSGFLAVQETIQSQGESILSDLFSGNIGLHDISLLRSLHLPKGTLPQMVSAKIVRQELKKRREEKLT